jgi:tetratricopeptide (TPR) repeat protein
MRRTLNIKFLIILLVAAALLGGGVYLVHGYQEKRNAGALLRRAEQAERKGDREEAEKYLSRYLAYRPDDGEALSRYGLILAGRADTGQGRQRALFVLERALVHAPGRDDVRREAAKLAMRPELSRFQDARGHLEALLKTRADDGELELQLGECHETLGRTGKPDEARKEYLQAQAFYEKAVAHAPHQVDGFVRLARLLRGLLNEPDQADRVMDAREGKDGLIAKNPESFRAFLERAGYRKQSGLPGTADDIARARQLAPDEADVIVAAAELAGEGGNLDEARGLLGRGIERYPQDVRMYQALAELEKRAGRPEQGLAALRQGIEVFPDRPELKWGLADLLIQAGKLDEAGEAIAGLRGKDKIRTEILDYLEGRIRAGKRQWAEAIRLLEKSRALMASRPGLAPLTAQADLLLAECYERIGNPEQQLAASRRALTLAPTWAPVLLQQAQALAALGRADEAVEAYRKIVAQTPAEAATLARLLIARNLRLPADRRDWAEVQKLVEQVEKQAPDALETALLRVDFLWAKGDPAAARARLKAVRKHDPKRVEPWITLAILAGRQGKPEETLAVLDEAQKQLGDRVELRLARADYWVRHGGDEARKALAELARNPEALSPEDQVRLKDGLADAHARIGDFKEAARLWNDVAESRPADLRVALRLFDLSLQEDAKGEAPALMQQAIERLRRIEGEDGALWRYGKAAYLVERASRGDRGRLDEAHTLLAEAARRRPGWARIPLLEARIAELERNPERAIAGYLKAIEGGEKQPETILRAVQLLNQNRRQAEADRLVQGLLEESPAPATGTIGKLAAESALRQGDPKRAVALARQAVRADSTDYRDHLWLGQILREAKEPSATVEAEFRRALALGAAAPDAWLAWIDYLAATDQKPRAEQAIEVARRNLPPDQALLVLARGFERIGARDKAEEHYRAVLAARPDDPAILQAVAMFYLTSGRSPDAQPWFRKILDPNLKATPEARVTARRGLALSLSTDPNHDARQFLEAMALVDQNLREEGNNVEDQRLKALLLATRRGRRREAIATFEDLARRSAPTAGEKFLLAQLHAANRETAEARGLLLGLVADDGANPSYLAALARVLLTRGEVEEAQPWIARLEQAAPRSFAAVELRARLLQKEGKGPEAVALLDRHVQGQPDDAGPAVDLLEGMGETADAERLLRAAVARSKNPQAVLALARFLGRRGHAGEALDLCENAWKTCPPEAVSNACLFVLDAARAGDDQRQRVAGWIKQAIARAPKSVPLLFDLANLEIFRGNYREAEALMRQIITLMPGNSGPLNNLAWLLALRGEKPDEALELVNRAIALEGAVPTALDTRGLVYLAMGRTEAALKDLTEAVTANPSPVLIFHLARAQLQADRRDAARASLHKAKDAGLEENTVDSLEKEAYRKLVATLER